MTISTSAVRSCGEPSVVYSDKQEDIIRDQSGLIKSTRNNTYDLAAENHYSLLGH